MPSLASNSLQMDAPQLAIQAEVDKRPILQPGDVCNERPAVPDRTHRVLIFSCKQAGNIVYLGFRACSQRQIRSAFLLAGVITFIAAYHYFRIFNSWVSG